MTDRTLAAVLCASVLVVAALSGGATYAVLSDSEELTVSVTANVPAEEVTAFGEGDPQGAGSPTDPPSGPQAQDGGTPAPGTGTETATDTPTTEETATATESATATETETETETESTTDTPTQAAPETEADTQAASGNESAG